VSNEFFAGIEQLDVTLCGVEAKTPAFYRDARMFSYVFPGNARAVRKMLPDSRFKLATLAPGVCAVHLTAFEYHDTDVGAYNEFAVGALLQSPDFAGAPVYNVTRQLLADNFHTYILRLPVNTELALRAGIDLYNYPKLMTEIDFNDSEGKIGCTVHQEGELICSVRGRKLAAQGKRTLKYFCHMYQDQQPQSAEFKLNALAFGMAVGPNGCELKLGDNHPVARELDKILLSKTPMIYFHIPQMQGILYGPDRLSLASISRFLEQALQVPLADFRARDGAKPVTRKRA